MIPTELLEHPALPTRSEKKRLGQYFTGIKLARLLAALAGARTANSIIDPMSGCGDMLEGSLLEGALPHTLGAIDIDPSAHQTCRAKFADYPLKSPSLLLGSAFDIKTLQKLPSLSWDLVITNPPYVRYQSLTGVGELSSLQTPSASQVRAGLLRVLELLPNLDTEDKRLFTELAKNYSGLADLAVPSWLLCAALVKPGGTLAMVVPESWLSREYAVVVQYLLLRWFKIQYIVEDANAAWFPEALVKTTLLVAKRIPRRSSAFASLEENYLHISLPSSAINCNSIVGRIFPNSQKAESDLAALLKQGLSGKLPVSKLPVTTEAVPFKQLSGNVSRATHNLNWLQKLEPQTNFSDSRIHLPSRIASWLETFEETSFTTLETFGAKIGQGLRTGANLFFYTDAVKTKTKTEIVAPSRIFNLPGVELPRGCTRPVLRKQAELPKDFEIDHNSLPGRVLVFHEFALPEDIQRCSKSFSVRNYTPLNTTVADFLRLAARTKTADNKLIPTLSAVAPNVREANPLDANAVPRFWYMLPAFAKRHSPDLLIPRVNGREIKAFINKGRRALIDANFSTIWFDDNNAVNKHAALALLNSSWSTTILEFSAAVLGGGALKVEAAHLRKLPIPKFSPNQWQKLSLLGQQLAQNRGSHEETQEAIDIFIIEAIVGKKKAQKKLSELQSLQCAQLAKRLQK
ncbi:MAG: SAM-dependent methyltransferase [Elusimicrobia bacterium]|nr:SAM-dependent methyltransferase [Elusimicrobiota bacterium]